MNTTNRIRPLFWCIVLSVLCSRCSSSKATAGSASAAITHQRLLLRDEGLSQLSYEDLRNPAANWYLPVPPGRDMQLTGHNRVLIGTGNGYEERDITTGKKLLEVTAFPGTIAARRLRNGNTLLSGVNWQGKKGIVLVETGRDSSIVRTIVYPGFDYARLVRETVNGHFLVTAGNIIFEGDDQGNIVWQCTVAGKDKSHAWQAIRLSTGQTLVSTGYSKNFQLFASSGKLQDSITAPENVHPVFFAGFQVLQNNHYLVTNWQGHGKEMGASGTQVLEFDTAGKLVWQWKQDAAKYSSLQGIILLDGLDLDRMHTEDGAGRLVPVQ
jgi:hypothetical protein